VRAVEDSEHSPLPPPRRRRRVERAAAAEPEAAPAPLVVDLSQYAFHGAG
jgi:hypothetical protein